MEVVKYWATYCNYKYFKSGRHMCRCHWITKVYLHDRSVSKWMLVIEDISNLAIILALKCCLCLDSISSIARKISWNHNHHFKVSQVTVLTVLQQSIIKRCDKHITGLLHDNFRKSAKAEDVWQLGTLLWSSFRLRFAVTSHWQD